MNNRGITLTSLIIYVIGMTVVIATIATLTSFFYKNINVSDIDNDTTTQYTKFSSIFLDEINKENNSVIDCKTYTETKVDSKTLEEKEFEVSYIIFSSGNQYTFKAENNSIYQNNIKICENIDKCNFLYSQSDLKHFVKVDFRTSSIDLTGDNAITYTLVHGISNF